MRIAIARSAAVAVVAAFASIAVMAGPAGATVYNGVIQSGSSLTIDPSGTPTVIPLGDPPSPPYTCAPNPSPWVPPSIDIDFDGSGGTSIDAPAAYQFARADFVAGGTTFQVQLEGVNDTVGTVDPVNDTVSQQVSMRARFYNCAGTTVVCTTNTVSPTLTGSWTGGNTPPGTAVVTGTAPVTTQFGCNAAIAAAINGKTVAVSLDVDF